jgi:hypothetical protein
MALPSEIQLITVQGKVKTGRADSHALTGTITFESDAEEWSDLTTGDLFLPEPEVVPFSEDADGFFTVDLVPSNSPQLLQQDWTWTATIKLTNPPVGVKAPDPFSFPVDVNTPGGVLQLVQMAPFTAPRRGVIVVSTGTVLVSPDAGNAIEVRSDGLYAATGSGGGVPEINATVPLVWDVPTATLSAPTVVVKGVDGKIVDTDLSVNVPIMDADGVKLTDLNPLVAVKDATAGTLLAADLPVDVLYQADADALQSAIDTKADNNTVNDLATAISGLASETFVTDTIASALIGYVDTAALAAALAALTPADIGAAGGATITGGWKVTWDGHSIFVSAGSDPAVVDSVAEDDVWIDET